MTFDRSSYNNSGPTFTLENARKYIQDLNSEALAHRAINHPFLHRLADGEFHNPNVIIKDFSYQYLAYSRDFTRYLTATIAKLKNIKHRQWLIKNLMEECGCVDETESEILTSYNIEFEWIDGVTHSDLYIRFLNGIGFDLNYRMQNKFCDEAKIWSQMFLNACLSGEASQSIGAIGLGTENIVKFIYGPILVAIKKFTKVTPEQRVFFDLHALIDDEHSETLNNIAVDYACYQRHREPLRNGMLMALNLRAGFFDAMLARAESDLMPVKEALN